MPTKQTVFLTILAVLTAILIVAVVIAALILPLGNNVQASIVCGNKAQSLIVYAVPAGGFQLGAYHFGDDHFFILTSPKGPDFQRSIGYRTRMPNGSEQLCSGGPYQLRTYFNDRHIQLELSCDTHLHCNATSFFH